MSSLALIELDDKEFSLFTEVIYRESGINLTEKKKALVQARIMRRLRELKIRTYQEYYRYLNNNYNKEIINLINCITTNKTEFFRESRHFDHLRNVVLPEYEQSGKRRIRVWSAGCSTGEEPYTIAIVFLEYFRGKHMPDIKILATDIDTQVLEKAMDGIYKKDVVDVMGTAMLQKYFLKGSSKNEGMFRIKEIVKRMIYYRRLNLLNDNFPMKKQFDIIFCRNVIIYFDSNSQLKLVKNFHRYLTNDGHLFMGHSETLRAAPHLFNYIGNSTYCKIV